MRVDIKCREGDMIRRIFWIGIIAVLAICIIVEQLAYQNFMAKCEGSKMQMRTSLSLHEYCRNEYVRAMER